MLTLSSSSFKLSHVQQALTHVHRQTVTKFVAVLKHDISIELKLT